MECRVNAIRDEGAAADVWLLQEWSRFDGLLLPVMMRQRFRLVREPSKCSPPKKKPVKQPSFSLRGYSLTCGLD